MINNEGEREELKKYLDAGQKSVVNLEKGKLIIEFDEKNWIKCDALTENKDSSKTYIDRKLFSMNEFGEVVKWINNWSKALSVGESARKKTILLSVFEIQSGTDRVQSAENLILQLPVTHDGRNSWLLNYGKRIIAVSKREKMGIKFDDITESAETTN